jgi:molybdopterin/thiamine biosynthesis adenylyltransferase
MKVTAGFISEIEKRAENCAFPDKEPFRGLSLSATTALSQKFGLSRGQIEVAALERDIIPQRYARNMKSFTPQDQLALLSARVCVVGQGGLGGGVTEILARQGIGALTLIDGDRFEESNLNRQFFSTESGLGKLKAEAGGNRITSINAGVSVTRHAVFLDETNAAGLLAGADVAVDCLDSLKARFVLEAASKTAGIPFVSAAVAGAGGHVTTIFPEDRGLRLIYGEPDQAPTAGAEASLGTLPFAVTLLATLECAEITKIILKKGGLLRNRLLVVDMMDNTFEVFQLAPQ